MSKTIISLAIPFTFAAEGKYTVSINNVVAEVEIEYIQNNEAMDKVMGVVSYGKMTLLPDDPEGIVNISKVVIEFPFLITNQPTANKFEEAEDDELPPLLHTKQICALYLNRLREVIRYSTLRYWLKPISAQHLNIYHIEEFDETNRGKEIFLVHPPSGHFFPINIKNESDVSSQIYAMLKDETRISLAENLFLDSLHFFHSSSFGEAVIIANMALETFVEEQILDGYKTRGKTDQEADVLVARLFNSRLHKIMRTTYFANTNKEALQKHPIWIKFENVRMKRKSVIHPRMKMLNLNQTKQTLLQIFEIMQWIVSQSKPN